MGKKPANREKGEPGSKAASPDDAAEGKSVVPQCWQELLEERPELQELEERKKKEREQKAKASKIMEEKKNMQKLYWEKERAKEDRKKTQADKKWNAQLEKELERAVGEGVVEAFWYDDGKWWANVGNGMWTECSAQYYCTLCSKHLNEGFITPHLDSDGHRKKVQWMTSMMMMSTSSEASATGAPSSSLAIPTVTSTALVVRQPTLEDWMEIGPDGQVRCTPCGKVLDDAHRQTSIHLARLERWKESRERERSGYPEPDLPYLAWVPFNEADETGDRWLKCLLCDKWCQDETSHTGTQANPAGSEGHQKNLRNHGPGSPWWENYTRPVRERWHPPLHDQTSASSTVAQQVYAPTEVAVTAHIGDAPAGWEVHKHTDGKIFYYNKTTCTSQWERPGEVRDLVLPAASVVSSDPHLPQGWIALLDSSGRTYYHNDDLRVSKWERPTQASTDSDIEEC